MFKNAPVDQVSPSVRLAAGLYIVATPIGNLGDITLRAIDILGRCDVVACEDTRVTGKLLKHLGIGKPMRRYDDHSAGEERDSLVAEMQNAAIVLVSDAGTPLISDPGYQLVRAAKAAGVAVVTLPGACAAIAGLTVSGLPSDRFCFAGFVPNKEAAREQFFIETGAIDATLIFYDTGPRLLKSLAVIDAKLPDRTVSVARELTKLYEESRMGTARELIDHYSVNPPRGEIVLLVGPQPFAEVSDLDVDTMLIDALKDYKLSQAATHVAKATGRDRKGLYTRAMELRAR